MVNEIVSTVAGFLWGYPLIILLVGTGIWLTLRLRGIQFTKLWHALYLALIKRKEDGDEPGDISHFQVFNDCAFSNSWNGEYRRCSNRNCCRRSRGSFLDVDNRISWDGYKICRSGISP